MTIEITVHTHYTTSQLECVFGLHTNYDLIGFNKQIIINNDN